MRFRRSGISVMLLIESSMLNEPTRNHFGLAARFLYLREGGFREQMRGNMQRRLQLSVSQNLEPAAEPLDEAALEQKGRCKLPRICSKNPPSRRYRKREIG